MPRFNITGGQNDLGVGVGFDQLLSKGTGRPVTDGLLEELACEFVASDLIATYLAVSQKLIPLLSTELADTVVLGSESIVPHQAVGRVLHTGGHHVVGLDVAQTFEGNAEGYSQNQSVM